MRYRVKLDIFEGPFDLLLFLIRKNEVDIYDIPIAKITDQFLEYIEVLNILDLNVAGDFIEMVAILMNIKARMLLPKPVSGDDEPEDPRTELVERLIEYKRFKDASADLESLQEERRQRFSRQYFEFIPREEAVDDETYLDQVSLFDLIMAFRQAIKNMPKVTHHEVRRIDVTVEQQSAYILERLKKDKIILFQDLMREMQDKMVLIVTFIALLDMVRAGQINVRQSDVFDDIRIKPGKAA